jgi:hypothetical protein
LAQQFRRGGEPGPAVVQSTGSISTAGAPLPPLPR